MKIKCTICGKTRITHSGNIKDLKKYHCRNCHGIYMKRLRKEGKVKHDFSAYRRVKNWAEANKNKTDIN